MMRFVGHLSEEKNLNVCQCTDVKRGSRFRKMHAADSKNIYFCGYRYQLFSTWKSTTFDDWCAGQSPFREKGQCFLVVCWPKIHLWLKSSWRQDPPPPPPNLDLSFGHFLLFFHHGIDKVEGHFVWKLHKKSSKEKLVKWAPEVARLYRVSKLYTKSAVPESSIALARLNFTF